MYAFSNAHSEALAMTMLMLVNCLENGIETNSINRTIDVKKPRKRYIKKLEPSTTQFQVGEIPELSANVSDSRFIISIRLILLGFHV
jgi:hypothetical protein